MSITNEKIIFNRHVIRKKGCWGWNGAKAHFGYGFMKSGGKMDRAHRVSWRIYKGKIPKGKLVLHKCDNPICSNPDHLYLGTQKDNIRDIYLRKRNHNQHGIKNHQSKLTEEKVIEIRKKYKGKHGELTMLGKEYGVNYNTIRMIIKKQRWKHI
jgi:hypothetical protein